MPKKKTRAVNVRISCKGSHCTVTPSVVLVQPGQTVVFTKPAAETVYVQVSGIGPAFRFKGKKPYEFKMPRTVRMGIYPYAVFCYERSAFCTGSSMPIIIVPRFLE